MKDPPAIGTPTGPKPTIRNEVGIDLQGGQSVEDDRGATPVWQALLDLRMALIAAGYHPIPTRDKVTWMPSWNRQPATIDEAGQKVWARNARGWGRKNPKAPGGYDPPERHIGTGFLCDDQVGGIDLDVQNADVGNTIYNDITEKYPQLLTAPIRLNSKNSKFLLVIRTTGDFHARRTAKYLDDDGNDHQVEIYGPARARRDGVSSGKYFACYGPHDREAGTVYRFEDDRDLTKVPRHELPVLTMDEVEDVMNIAEAILAGQGWERVSRQVKSDDATFVHDLTDDMTFDTETGGMSLRELELECIAGDEVRCSAANWEKGANNTSRCVASVNDQGVFGIWDYNGGELHRRVKTGTPDSVRDLFAKLTTAPLFQSPVPRSAGSMATPFRLPDESTIERRPWIYGRHYIRGFVSATVSPGGLGKSTMAMTEAMAIASGKSLLGPAPDARGRVWYVNLEDPRKELDMRAVAIAKHHGVTPELLGDRLLMDSGREQSFIIADAENGTRILEPIVEAITRSIQLDQIDVIIIDPFVSSHSVNENDNSAIDAVVKTWAAIAEATNCAVELIHHVRKTSPNEELTADSARGASAFLAAARSVRVLNGMTAAEGSKRGIEETWRYFRLGVGKANMAPPPDRDAWLQKESVELSCGEQVGVVSPWTMPSTIIIDVEDIESMRTLLSTQTWRHSPLASDWIGLPIAEALVLDLGPPASVNRTPQQSLARVRVEAVIAQLLAQNVIVRTQVEGPSRHKVQGYAVV